MIKCTCLMTFAAKFLFCVLVSSMCCVPYFCFSAFRSDNDPVFSNENTTRKLSCCWLITRLNLLRKFSPFYSLGDLPTLTPYVEQRAEEGEKRKQRAVFKRKVFVPFPQMFGRGSKISPSFISISHLRVMNCLAMQMACTQFGWRRHTNLSRDRC